MRALALVCAALALALVTASTGLRMPANPFAFEVEVSSTAAGRVQVYYDIGRGLSEADSVSAPIAASDRRAVVQLQLPAGTYRTIRFDPIDTSATVTFARARIVTVSGSVIRALPNSVFVPNDQVASYATAAGETSFRVPAGRNDPNLLVSFDPPLRLHFGWELRLRSAARATVIAWAAWIAVLALGSAGWTRRSSLWANARRHPHVTLWVTAAAAACAACYPVVFCGKSFVSPNVTALLRANPPTVPGVADTTHTDLHVPDPAVAMWQDVPYSAIEHDAIWRDHALPLWNRYLSCGVTLIGQGQSMLGDPIHLLVIAARGASWAWDVKFVAARLVFAAGVGTAIWALTGDLVAALLSIAAAAFVAFFNYRFNHPAVFSFSYSAWIFCAWTLIANATSARTLRWALLLLATANIAVVGSGTVKEADALLLAMNAAGAVLWLLVLGARRRHLRALERPDDVQVRNRVRALPIVITLLATAAVSAPLWLPFFDALRESTTAYEKPVVWQAPRAWVIGLFDDLFYTETNATHKGFIPSANFLVLLGVALATASIRLPFGARRERSRHPLERGDLPDRENRSMYAVWVLLVAATTAVLIAHEFVPARWILSVPLLRSVYHVHNTFDAVAVVALTFLAGFGFHAGRALLTKRGATARLGITAVAIAALLAIYFHDLRQVWMAGAGFVGWIRGLAAHEFFYLNIASMLAAGAVLIALARHRLRGGRIHFGAVVAAVIAMGILLYRHGLHVDFGVGESYLTFPMPRANLHAPSASTSLIEPDTNGDPSRVVGTDANLINGWNAMYDLEGLNGPDALINPWYRELLTADGLIPADDWRLRVSAGQIAQHERVLAFLGARHVLTDSATVPDTDYVKVGTGELNVFRSGSAWPRAFFVSRLATYRSTPELLSLVRAGSAPFAAVQIDSSRVLDTRLQPFAKVSTTPAETTAATRYKLTANTTAFHIEAPSPGIAVLHETWLPADFRATLDGKRVPYFRVNHAFKAVVVPTAGDHTIVFTYWPKHLTLALWMALGGGVALLITLWRLVRDEAGDDVAELR